MCVRASLYPRVGNLKYLRSESSSQQCSLKLQLALVWPNSLIVRHNQTPGRCLSILPGDLEGLWEAGRPQSTIALPLAPAEGVTGAFFVTID